MYHMLFVSYANFTIMYHLKFLLLSVIVCNVHVIDLARSSMVQKTSNVVNDNFLLFKHFSTQRCFFILK